MNRDLSASRFHTISHSEVIRMLRRDPSNDLINRGWARIEVPFLTNERLASFYGNWEQFFRSPHKNNYRSQAQHLSGYFENSTETAKGWAKPDPKEFFHYYRHGACPPYCYANSISVFEALSKTAKSVLKGIATRILGIREVIDRLNSSKRLVMRITRYDERTTLPFMNAPHEDVNLITLLPRATAPGLLVRETSGIWRPIRARDQQCIVLIGDMLAEASNNQLKATRHCVESVQLERLSISFFANPNDNV